MTLLYQAPASAGPWRDRHLWYQTAPSEVPNTASALELISGLARVGMHVVTLPAIAADADPRYVSSVSAHAKRRGIAVIPNIGSGVLAARGHDDMSIGERFGVLEDWFDKGARGVELGRDNIAATHSDGAHEHSGWNVRELQAWMQYRHPDSILSISLRADSFDSVSEHALEDFFDVLRFDITGATPLTASNYFHQTAMSFQLYRAAGALPAWNATWNVLNNISGRISQSGLALATIFLPGIVHFEKDVVGAGPSTRHAMRMRDSLGLHKAHLLIDDSKAADGFIQLTTERADMLINFGPHHYEIPNDGRVLMSSMIALPERGPNLLVPPGEVAWIRRTSSF
ncbi:Uncharacterised protein [Trueperella bialowiezensis]|uniref:Uncharacterized protein n=2 Tax=Trueperella bialowiezensis TaxID=312285 RepID=A0A3S5EVY4_9ACTO|nr:Uncharacterised protein [Trueperella bialowiezensis]